MALAATPALAAQVGAFLGLLSWALFWNRSEHHLWVLQYVQIFAITPIVGTVLLSAILECPRTEGLKLLLSAQATYVVAVWANMLVYRAFFHPLRKFPGPFTWKLSKFVQSYHNRNFENYKIVDKLHKQYGEYVRTGKSLEELGAQCWYLSRPHRLSLHRGSVR